MHEDGIRACEEFLNQRTDHSLPKEDLCYLIWLILSSNEFTFNGAYYLHEHRIAVGNHMVPSYVYLFMGKFECRFLQTQDRLPLVWWWYINNVLAIWLHGEPVFDEFLRELIHHHMTYKFKVNWPAEEVTFVDTRVHLNPYGTIVTNSWHTIISHRDNCHEYVTHIY